VQNADVTTRARAFRAAAIVLAGGRSSRMGSPKAALQWHGSTLLRRVTGIASRAVSGPVVVVSAPEQSLPALDRAVQVVVDEREGRGPLQGLAAGLAAIGDRAAIAYVSSTDVPLLHPAFVRHVVSALDDQVDAVVPEVHGHLQPLAAAYRVDVHTMVEELLAADRLAVTSLLKRCRLRRLTPAEMLRDPDLARLDPGLHSVTNVNEPADYERIRALPAPAIRVGGSTVRAWTLGAVASKVGVTLGGGVVPVLNRERVAPDSELPLVAGDTVAFQRSA
jgi:molybdenum cofactor guanylyltransferase